MLVHKLQLHHFRNFESLDLDLGAGLTLLCGRNGQGKSNLLESIHLLTQGHSPRTTRNAEMIAWGQQSLIAIAQGTANGQDRRHAIELGKSQHRIKVDGDESTNYAKLLGSFGLVMMGPDDLEIIKGGPAERRRFLDALFSQHSPAYLDALRRYHRALKQRNALLRIEGLCADEYWAAITHQWAVEAARIVEMRLAMLQGLIDPFKEIYAEISGGSEKVHMVYHGIKAADNTDLVDAYMQSAHAHFEQEKKDGITREGPHRDELLLLISGKPIRHFGSQGQCRSAALSLKLASAELLRREMGQAPILLLDDVFAELDGRRQDMLAHVVRAYGQVIAASPDIGGVPIACDRVIQVQGGSVSG